MSNVLKVSHQEAIRSLDEKGWSQRRIARELGINGRTVRRYIQGSQNAAPFRPPAQGIGLKVHHFDPRLGECGWKGTGGLDCRTFGPQERCEPFEAAIGSKMEAGLSAQRIYQDLVEENGFLGSYQSVKRFVRRLKEEAARAGVAHRMPARRRDAGRFRAGSPH